MKEHPILFSAPMVRAILAGTKTQTRRAVKGSINAVHKQGSPVRLLADRALSGFNGVDIRTGEAFFHVQTDLDDYAREVVRCPFGTPGDRLWVKETWGLWRYGDRTDWYRGRVNFTRTTEAS